MLEIIMYMLKIAIYIYELLQISRQIFCNNIFKITNQIFHTIQQIEEQFTRFLKTNDQSVMKEVIQIIVVKGIEGYTI